MSAAITTRFRIEGMDCAGCAKKIDTATRRIAGVNEVNISVVSGTMTVEHANETAPSDIVNKVKSLGYGAAEVSAPVATGGADDKSAAADEHGFSAMHGQDQDHDGGDTPWWRTGKARLTALSGLAVIVAFTTGQLAPQLDQWAFIIAMLVGLVPIARRAYSSAINGSPFSIETLMSVAAIGAVFINAAQEAAIVVLLFLIGELLEGVATGRARASIKALATLVPKVALREVDGETRQVPAEVLGLDDVILVRPGDRIAADGIIISGQSAIDEAPVTGESVPQQKQVDDKVFAGTVNQNGALRIRVTAAAADNTIARIIALVEEAQESKAPTERFIDRFSRYYTPGVMVVAVLIAIVPPLVTGAAWDEWIYKGLAILLIGCPCALVISTPAAIAAALSAGARQGLLMKGGAVLEQLGKINMVALDKTGTLTAGKPQVTDIIAGSRSAKEVLALAAALEMGSNHPLASAILAEATREGLTPAPVSDAGAVGGKGVVGSVDGIELFLGSPRAAKELAELSAELAQQIASFNDAGKSVSVLVASGQIAGIIAMRDEPRADAAEGLLAIREMGAEVVMLTGDNARTASAIGAQLGIEARAELMPEDKQAIVGSLRASGKMVAKVGDGINDAPALAAADIGIAMGGGTDVALETADAAVLHGRVTDIANMMGLSRATMANISQNITIALGLKGLFLVTTILGITGLWPAILADTGATVLVTANAMRLLGWKGRGAGH
ncbi:heavy metal translocating P-type ATPase [Devosia rhodophyticola]|uniref:P-type Zn(2+) transporter n=1 Tax=Devosia rhodophyticola TaxID=3026423 RepID=A0ABY7Z1A7_9HYPH|nr:heavy metal translocating P-type ATPase [Devosia rhodophyticola]WDR07000.1 heavy metal translocating P-type ATPase [Devosia rhodophyticola]